MLVVEFSHQSAYICVVKSTNKRVGNAHPPSNVNSSGCVCRQLCEASPDESCEVDFEVNGTSSKDLTTREKRSTAG